MIKKIIVTIIILAVIMLTPSESFAGRGGGGGGGRGGMTGTTGVGNFGATGGSTGAVGGTSIVGIDEAAITLIPYPERHWIVVRAPAEIMEQIAGWIDQFDSNDLPGSPTEYDTLTVQYVDVSEVSDSLMLMMEDLSPDFARNISIQPLVTSRQLLVFGKKEYRDMVKKLLLEIDLPTNQLKRKTFQLRYADPEDIREKVEEIFALTSSTSSSLRTTNTRTATTRTGYSGTSGALSADTVIVTTYPSLRQVVVLASEDNMDEIEKQIKEWDSPIVWKELKPRIVTVKNIDPVQLVALLQNLFSSSTTGGTNRNTTSTNRNSQTMLNTSYSSASEIGEQIIGPLYGKLSFIEIPETKKIIVASSIVEAYDLVTEFIEEIDESEPAVVPKIVELKYADCEDLSRRLNAIFAESGTSTSIEMTVTGLSSSSSMDTGSSGGSSSTQQETYTPPWSGSGGQDETMPISSIFGKVRFMPEPNTKSILLLAPEQFIDELETLIYELDVSGKQVMIETIIVEVEHNALTSLGVEFSSDGSKLSAIGRYGLGASSVFGEVAENLADNIFERALIQEDDFALSGVSTSIFIDFLKKKAKAHILNQQTLWTKDNEEANFFKGKRIPFVTGTTSTTSSTGAVVASDTFDFELVGMEVRVRPRITPENNVNMIINVNYSQQTGDKGLGNMDILSQMNSTTNMIVQDGETIILGGILFQKDSTITYKVPGLGDIPVLGQLFRHDSINKENTELLVFIKPHVIDKAPEELDKLIEKTRQALENSQTRLSEILGQLGESMKEIQEN